MTFTVMNTNASGSGSLAAAVASAATDDQANTINFEQSAFSMPHTITLGGNALVLNDTGGTQTITGPAAGVTISGGGLSPVFGVKRGVTATISGLTITGGSTSGFGGGVEIGATADLTMTNCTISGNSAGVSGGGLENLGTLSLNDCTISGNSASDYGGGLLTNGAATLTNCTISGNSAGDGGGLAGVGTVNLTDCTISANSAGMYGGGLYSDSDTTTTLTDTIVAGNNIPSGPSDIQNSGTLLGSSNLIGTVIGTGGSGGLTSGTDHNIVLTSLSSLGLAPLGSYGGPTQTMALLPGSAAIGAGESTSPPIDQRGAPRPAFGAADIGAFEDQGYTLAVSSGSTQTTLVNTAVSAPLVAQLTENFANAPLPGVTIGFSAPSSPASATLSAASAVTDANGLASVTATANATAGIYTVTASAGGVTSSASFSLTNQIEPSFSRLSNPTITYGREVSFGGTLAAGSQVPAGEDVAVTVDGATHDAAIFPDGFFLTLFNDAEVVLNASSTAYNVSYAYTSDGVFLAANDSSQLTVNPAPLAITAVSDTKVYDASASSSEMPTVVGTLYNGNTVTGLTQAFTSKNVLGTNDSRLIVSGYIVNDGDNGNDYAVATQTASGTITAAPLVITAVSDTKVYDGSTSSSKTPSVGTLYGGDNVSGLTEAFSSKDVLGNNNSTLKVTGYTVNDGDNGKDYTVTTQTASGTITPAALTITAVSDTKVYDGTTSSSKTPTVAGLYNGDNVIGLTEAFSSKDVLATNNSTLNVTGYTVNDGDNGNDYTVTTETASGTITPAPLTITAVSDTKVYDGSTSSSKTPTFGMLYDGDTVTGLAQAFSSKDVLGTNNSTLKVTGYTVNDGDNGKDYTVTTKDASGTIKPAPLTVHATDLSAVYGSPLPAPTDTITGFVGGDKSSVVSGAPALAMTAAPGASAGDYPITIAAGTLSAVNYDFPAADLIAGTLKVTRAPLVIKAVSTSMFAGEPVPALAAVYSGLVNGDTPEGLTVPAVLFSAAGPSSLPGTYPITVVGGISPNYTTTYVPGTLTVNPAPATVESVSVQRIKLHKHKTVKEIVLQFSEALDAATAQSINSYTLATVPKNKKQKSKPVPISGASYNSSAFTVTLMTRKALALYPPLELTVEAASLLDALGRELDGNDSGQPGANFTAVLRKAGTSITSARALPGIG